MSAREPGSLSGTLIVVKGAAAPSRPLNDRPKRLRAVRDDARLRVSIRLEPGQHLRLRLAAAHLRKTVHEVLHEAIDRHLLLAVPGAVEPGCSCLRGSDSDRVVPFRVP